MFQKTMIKNGQCLKEYWKYLYGLAWNGGPTHCSNELLNIDMKIHLNMQTLRHLKSSSAFPYVVNVLRSSFRLL